MTDPETPALLPDGLTTCHECDTLHRLRPLAPGASACCTRCGALLYRQPAGGVDRPLALAIAALGLFVLSNVYPLIALELEGRVEESLVLSGVGALWRSGMTSLAILMLLTSFVFPLITLLGLLWLLLPVRLGFLAPGTATVFRAVKAAGPWTLLGVFMLGVLIAFVKLADLATVLPGVSLYAFAGLIVCAAGAMASFDSSLIWPRVGPPSVPLPPRARGADLGLFACHTCTLLLRAPRAGRHAQCPRCATPVHVEDRAASVSRTWALLVSAAVLIVPANVYPVMTVIRFGRGEPSTILGGVVHLIESGLYGLALIIFVASIAVPVIKLVLLGFLLLSVQRRSPWRPRERTRLYRITEVVGAWSMVDIFVVGILTALVSLGTIASVEPGIGATFFGAVVVVTMFAAQSFDPRLIWDHAEAPA